MKKRQQIVAGIDIGTHYVKVIVSEKVDGTDKPKILGYGIAPSRGVRHGYIIHHSDTVKSIKQALKQAEKKSGHEIDEVFLGVGGVGLSSTIVEGHTIVTRADGEVTDLDIERVIQESQEAIPAAVSTNRKVIHAIPLEFTIDGEHVLGQPVGLKANKLSIKTLFVTYLEHHLNDMLQVVEDAGVSVIDVMASPLAASLGVLSKSQKIAGCILANIGSETLSLAVFENGTPLSIEVFPIGSNDITNDIALGLQLSLEDAEHLKKGNTDQTDADFSQKKLEEIIDARLSDIFEIIEAHLKKIRKGGLLPAGILITGGGSGISDISDIAKAYLKLPTKVSTLICDEKKSQCLPRKFDLQDSTWAVAYGLGIFGLHADQDGLVHSGAFRRSIKQGLAKFKKWVGQFLP